MSEPHINFDYPPQLLVEIQTDVFFDMMGLDEISQTSHGTSLMQKLEPRLSSRIRSCLMAPRDCMSWEEGSETV
ncbi:hypothetical protein AC579_4695 [Pseudocercospora musae]|uniref:Uncharacterized protein n=1 Tax=Pseudocercospora musae TaxID=113226 RepID=A0A139IBN2_9PEZI|nr:hypothetical protein AC579_4695 [Pseudocercospora musae]